MTVTSFWSDQLIFTSATLIDCYIYVTIGKCYSCIDGYVYDSVLRQYTLMLTNYTLLMI
jgi:hypothetical protein